MKNYKKYKKLDYCDLEQACITRMGWYNVTDEYDPGRNGAGETYMTPEGLKESPNEEWYCKNYLLKNGLQTEFIEACKFIARTIFFKKDDQPSDQEVNFYTVYLGLHMRYIAFLLATDMRKDLLEKAKKDVLVCKVKHCKKFYGKFK